VILADECPRFRFDTGQLMAYQSDTSSSRRSRGSGENRIDEALALLDGSAGHAQVLLDNLHGAPWWERAASPKAWS